MTDISINKAFLERNTLFIDVRSPKEFEEDHIPEAVNIPILDNEERHIVGWTYKKVGKDKAIDMGWEIFDKKIKAFEAIVKNNTDKKVIFYCFRGGLRSGCFADHFKDAFKLEGGYKSYRGYVREELGNVQLPKDIIVLYGLTGSGKTEVIKKLKDAIDLEGLAQHRSSLFGAVGLRPVSQKMFETSLLKELQKPRKKLILEGESRKIGNVMIPDRLFDAMQKGRKVNIACPLKIRANRIVMEYFDTEKKAEEVKRIVPRLKNMIGKKKVDEYQNMLENKKFMEFTESMLLEYYDPRYQHSAKEFKFEKEISSESIKKAVEEIKLL